MKFFVQLFLLGTTALAAPLLNNNNDSSLEPVQLEERAVLSFKEPVHQSRVAKIIEDSRDGWRPLKKGEKIVPVEFEDFILRADGKYENKKGEIFPTKGHIPF